MINPLRVIQSLRQFDRRAKMALPEGIFAAFIDLGYFHYALGDFLTIGTEISCLAIDNDCSGIDYFIEVDPGRPAAPAQGFINTANYTFHLENLAPAILCTPMLRSIRFLRDQGRTAGFFRQSAKRMRRPIWPSYRSQLVKRMPYPLNHSAINEFYRRHGYVPNLKAPKGYEAWAEAFVAKAMPSSFIVAIHPRQSRLSQSPATTYRDADLGEWKVLIRHCASKHPDIRFILMGGFSEWHRDLFSLPNITIPRALGLNLAHELALMQRSNLFLGSSSGFATMATFSEMPYLISNIEHFFAPYAGVEVGENYPFAKQNQALHWQHDDSESLINYLEKIYNERQGVRETASSTDAG